MRTQKKKTNKTADVKALELLNYKMRSEKELKDKLAEYDFEQSEIDEAVEYARSFGYLNDERYAETYVLSRGSQKGRAFIKRELIQKGISPEIIDEALDSVEEEEDEICYQLLLKKAGQPHELSDKEYGKLYRFLAGRGFKSSAVYSALKKYND